MTFTTFVDFGSRAWHGMVEVVFEGFSCY